MHRRSVELHAFERVGELLDLLLRRREDNRLGAGRFAEQCANDLHLLVFVADVDALLDRFIGFRYGDVHFGRIAQDLFGHLPDFRRQRSREHDRLPFGGQLLDDLHDVVEEAHVEHPVGFVEHEIAHVREVDSAVGDVGQQASRRRHDDVRAPQHALLLLFPADAVAAAVNHRRGEGQEVGESLELYVDLLGQFARGHDDQRFDHVVGVAFAQQFVQQRQRVRGRFTCPGLRAADQVFVFQYDGDGVFLYRRHLFEVHRFEAPQDIGVQAEFVESHTICVFSLCRLSVLGTNIRKQSGFAARSRKEKIPGPGKRPEACGSRNGKPEWKTKGLRPVFAADLGCCLNCC